jgi:hypothetical protein
VSERLGFGRVTEPIAFTVNIEITDEHIERAIIKATSRVDYPEDDTEHVRPLDLRALVEKSLHKTIDKAIATTAAAVTREIVDERVRAALDAGFPTHTSWGQKTGSTTLSELVGAMVFKKGNTHNGEFDLETVVRREAVEHAKRLVAEHVKAASAQLDAMFKDAAAEGIATLLKRKLGVA